MANFSLSITIPDNKVTDVMAALNWHYGQFDDNGTLRDRTGAELKALVNAGTIQALKDIYKRHQEYLRAQQVIDDNVDIA